MVESKLPLVRSHGSHIRFRLDRHRETLILAAVWSRAVQYAAQSTPHVRLSICPSSDCSVTGFDSAQIANNAKQTGAGCRQRRSASRNRPLTPHHIIHTQRTLTLHTLHTQTTSHLCRLKLRYMYIKFFIDIVSTELATSRLRKPTVYPRPVLRTKRYCSAVSYALLNFQ